jgi:aspartyl protease family protein
VRRPLRFIVLALILFGLFAAMMRRDDGTIAGLDEIDFATFMVRTIMVAVVGASLMVVFRGRMSQALTSALAWLAIALVLAVGYTYRFELRGVGERVMAEMVPGRAATHGRTVEIARGGGGGFAIIAEVNGARLPLVLDTGATSVVLTQEAARSAGLPLEVLSYSVNVDTANGRGRAAPVTLDRIMIGGITERQVAALIAQPGALKANLLGMSFLNRLESWEVRGDKLMLRAFP